MAGKNWAITIGINQYKNLKDLHCPLILLGPRQGDNPVILVIKVISAPSRNIFKATFSKQHSADHGAVITVPNPTIVIKHTFKGMTILLSLDFQT
jgi:hypothetical protein